VLDEETDETDYLYDYNQGCVRLTADEMKSSSFVDMLHTNTEALNTNAGAAKSKLPHLLSWRMSGLNENGGYPLLNRQAATDIRMPAYVYGVQGMDFTLALTAYGSSPITWRVIGGDLPAGLTLSGGIISGVPASRGTFRVLLSAENSLGPDVRELIINIVSRPATAKIYYVNVIENGNVISTLPVSVNTETGSVTLQIDEELGSRISSGSHIILDLSSIPDAVSYTFQIPNMTFYSLDKNGSLLLITRIGSISIPSRMLSGMPDAVGKTAEITLSQGNKAGLSDDMIAQIGDRPLIRLTMTPDGSPYDWSNHSSPVTVSIPYTPTPQELENPESIVIWYLDGSGNITAVPNGCYDPAAGAVVFRVTHFSDYAVGFMKADFNDLAPGAWYSKAVRFIAARGITGGTGAGSFSPDALLTRGQFIVMLMRAYGITPDTAPTDNFTDAGNTYYTGYLAAAKRLGISAGIGNNTFAPETAISRQEMFTLLYNALKAINQLPQAKKLPDGSPSRITDFTDSKDIAAWAREAMTELVDAGVISGSSGKLSPTATTTRAEMAQVLYNLLAP
jgi:hypothetical protein